MKTLIISRHGTPNMIGLNKDGCAQIENQLLLLLSRKDELGAIELRHSFANRCVQSAQILAEGLGIIPIQESLLHHIGEPTESHFQAIFELIKTTSIDESIDTIILCTHGDYTCGLLNHISKSMFNKIIFVSNPQGYIPKGGILIFNWDTGETELYCPDESQGWAMKRRM